MAAFDPSVCSQCNNPRILGTPCQNCSSSMAASQHQTCRRCGVVFTSVFPSSYCMNCDITETALGWESSMAVSPTDLQPPPLGSSSAEPVQQPHGLNCSCTYCCPQPVYGDVDWKELTQSFTVQASTSSSSSHEPFTQNQTPVVSQEDKVECSLCGFSVVRSVSTSERSVSDELNAKLKELKNHRIFSCWDRWSTLAAAKKDGAKCLFKTSEGKACTTKVGKDYEDHLQQVHIFPKKFR